MPAPRKKVRSSILIKCLVTAFPHINYVPSQCLASWVKMRSSLEVNRFTNKRHSTTIGTIGLPRLAGEVTWARFSDVYQKENRNKRSDHLATQETASYILFSAKPQTYKQNTYRKWSWKRFISSLSDYYRTVFSVLSRGNESLVIFTHG